MTDADDQKRQEPAEPIRGGKVYRVQHRPKPMFICEVYLVDLNEPAPEPAKPEPQP